MPVRYVVRQVKQFFVYRVLHVDDTPHRIALGVALGIFWAWTPTMGIQMILTIATAALFRANKVVGIPFVWISNIFTIVPIYLPNYWVGTGLLGTEFNETVFYRFVDAAVMSGTWLERFNAGWEAMWGILAPLWVGSMVVATALGLLSYLSMRMAVLRYRRWWHKRHPEPPWAQMPLAEEIKLELQKSDEDPGSGPKGELARAQSDSAEA